METTADKIRNKAIELGFTYCGFAQAGALEKDREFLLSYLRDKRNAGLHYLEREPEKRTDPRLVVEGTRTIIGLLLNYFPQEIIPEEDNFIITKYAYGRDYHKVLKERSQALIRFMKQECGSVLSKSYVDSGPVLEKAWARQCGVGWTGKNTLLIRPGKGSFHFIAIILTDLAIEPDQPMADHCGKCRLCLDACPTGALENPYNLNPSKCLAYLTLDKEGALPAGMKGQFHNRIYGCDICQDACPHNKKAVASLLPEFVPHPMVKSFRKKDWLNLTQEQFDIMFRESAIHRGGYKRLIRNIRFANDDAELNQNV